MRKFLQSIIYSIIRFEHIIYCATNCKVELFLHKAWYKYLAKKYDEYYSKKNINNPLNQ